jgi:hypothetical protein
MIAVDIQQLVVDLQQALRAHGYTPVVTGTITLNLNDAVLQSVKTETYVRVVARQVTDRRATPRR